MLSEDNGAFVERLEVARDGNARLRRRIARTELEVLGSRFEVHLAESAVTELERLLTEGETARRGARTRELGSIQRHLHAKQNELAVRVARLDRLEAKAQERARRRPPHVMFRLHSGGHCLSCSEQGFARLSARQLDRPVRVTKRDGRTWWWYLNRSWWEDEGMRLRELADLVLRRDLQRMLAADALTRARVAVLGEVDERDEGLPVPDSLHLSVWSRCRGRCVDCGSTDRLNFDRIIATSERRRTARNFELRCHSCRDTREHNAGRARIVRARVEAVGYESLR